MQLPRNAIKTTQKRSVLGRCQQFFWLGVFFDMAGVVVLFTGVFADLLFYDLLLYLGSIIIFFSLLWWVFWYTGNLEMPAEQNLVFGRPFHMHSFTLIEALRHSVSHRFSLSLSSVSHTFMRIRKRRRRAVLSTPAPTMTVTDQLEKQPEKEKEKGGSEIVESSFGGKNLSPESEAVRSSDVVHSPGSDADPPWFLKRSPSQPVLPVFTKSSLDQSPTTLSSPKEFLAPVVLVSKSQPAVSLASTTQPPVPFASKSQPVVHLASTTQPPVPFASKSQPAVHLALTTQPPVPLASKSQPTVSWPSTTWPPVPLISKSQPEIPMSPQSQLQVTPAPQIQLQNLVQAPTQTVQASQSQAVATQVSLMQPQYDLSSLTVLDTQFSQAVQDSQTLPLIQKTSQTRVLIQEISLGQSLNVQEFHNKPVAQVSETQFLSPQELPDTPRPPSKTAAPVTQTQQSVPTKSPPASAAEEESSPL